MPQHTPLIATIVAALALAFVLGAVANRLRVSPLVGYLLAGVAVGPYTPGFVADQGLANQLAEIGVILLMFGVGMHFSLKDLLSVRAVAVPGALARILIVGGIGVGFGALLGWRLGGGFIFGLALSVASTVVLLRLLQERRLLDTEWGRIAVGWLIVEDLAMVLALVLMPAMAALLSDNGTLAQRALSFEEIAQAVLITLGKVAAFLILMLLVGRRVIPWVLHYVAHTGSRELFRLAVLVVALGVAYGAATLFDVSFALGAFFAGMVLAESELSQQAANETLPLRDAFAVLFFVSVGMLFDPTIVVRDPWAVAATVFLIVVGKTVIAFLIVLALGYTVAVALPISISLAQIGEFSFILAALGLEYGLMTERARDLVLAGAIISIVINPILFGATDKMRPWLERRIRPRAPEDTKEEPPEPEPLPITRLKGHAVLIGYGRVGSAVAERLLRFGVDLYVIEASTKAVESLRAMDVEAISGNAASAEVLATANLAEAAQLFVAVPNAFEAGQIVEQARAVNPHLHIVARSHLDAETEYLKKLGADVIIMGEREIARAMAENAVLPALQPLREGEAPA
jgi:CPA2 family monovalent cation:H+ antiporter-2